MPGFDWDKLFLALSNKLSEHLHHVSSSGLDGSSWRHGGRYWWICKFWYQPRAKRKEMMHGWNFVAHQRLSNPPSLSLTLQMQSTPHVQCLSIPPQSSCPSIGAWHSTHFLQIGCVCCCLWVGIQSVIMFDTWRWWVEWVNDKYRDQVQFWWVLLLLIE